MHDRVDVAHQPVDDRTIGHVVVHERHPWVGLVGLQVREAPAGREAVEHGDAIVALEQRVDEMRTDEPGAAGDEHVGVGHGLLLGRRSLGGI